jgi:NAD(P)-dependent dehydrogenase (short-subunit alcohol dehydrogenase family)
MARQRYPVNGKVVLVTGAARGIGAEVARRLRANGARLVLAGLEPELLERLAGELGPDAIAVEVDVTDREQLDGAVDAAIDAFGGIDVVIANAGIAPSGTVLGQDPAAFDKTVEVNLLGVHRTLRAAGPHVVARRGYMLVVASAAAALHNPMMGAYSASKAGAEALADSLRQEVAHTGTRVGVAYFSFIDTDMVRTGFQWRSSEIMRERAGGPFNHITPLPVAGERVVAGIERRARRIVVPRWVAPVLDLRGILQPLAELAGARAGVEDAVKAAEAEPTVLTTSQPGATARPAP